MRKILLADDQAHIVRVIRLTLERNGYEVVTAANGAEALDMLAQSPFDILITDIEMPRMNGKELCEAIQETFPGRKPYTFIITAKTDSELRKWAAGLTDAEFLEKPLSLRQLNQKLKNFFAEHPGAA